jgi:hypothetical protein
VVLEVLAVQEGMEVMEVAMAHHMDMVFKIKQKDNIFSSVIEFPMMNIEEIY